MTVTCMNCIIRRLCNLIGLHAFFISPHSSHTALSLHLHLLVSNIYFHSFSSTSLVIPSTTFIKIQFQSRVGQTQDWLFEFLLSMGSGVQEEKEVDYERIQRLAKTSVVLLWSFFLSLGGGLTLVWWELEYHPTNSQLWMVPFGLIMLVTPAIVSLSLLVSDICNSSSGQPSASSDESVHHPV